MAQNTQDLVYLYDSTLRDGAQTYGVDFSPIDKQDIAIQLDQFGIDYIEGGWPGANPTDDSFFEDAPTLAHAKIAAFGMTRRAQSSVENDPVVNALINSGAQTLCFFGKSWDFHVTDALGITLEENLALIADSIAYGISKGREVLFDAEHFFDGYKANPEYALACLTTAYEKGARWVVLCDTNGGTLPHEVEAIVTEVVKHIPGDHVGIHCHNDTGNAVANSLIAVEAGARHIQGTLNGLGERCGNADLVTIIPNLILKMGYKTNIKEENLVNLVKLSRFLDDRLNRPANAFAPYVGSAAFAHKGGVHVSAVNKNSTSYEHIDPEIVGNERTILVSKQAGRSNIISRLKQIGLSEQNYPSDKIAMLVDEVKQREAQGYAYDSADASFELLARKMLEEVPSFFHLERFRVVDERRWNAKGELITLSEATVKCEVAGIDRMSVSEGNGPVNALDTALRKALVDTYPELKDIKLIDYKVRILTPSEGTKAVIRVLIETQDSQHNRWSTVGVSSNVIDASYEALKDSITFKLLKNKLTQS